MHIVSFNFVEGFIRILASIDGALEIMRCLVKWLCMCGSSLMGECRNQGDSLSLSLALADDTNNVLK